MAENQKEEQGKFQGCCEGMPFADMMRKMMEGKHEGKPFNCAEVIDKMMDGKKASSFNCAEMMGKMAAGKEGVPFNCAEMMAKMMGRSAKEDKA
jgi:hypothetical protein